MNAQDDWEELTPDVVSAGPHMLPICLRTGHVWVWRDDIRDEACERCRVIKAMCGQP